MILVWTSTIAACGCFGTFIIAAAIKTITQKL
jgi:hypothetical protein